MSAPTAGTAAPFARSFGTVCLGALTSEPKNTFKTVGYIGKWWELFDPKISPNLKNFCAVGGDAKNLFSAFEMPKNVSEIVESFSGKGKSVYKKIDSICRLSNNGGDFMKLLSRYFTIPHMKHIEGASTAFTLVGSVNGAIEHGRLLWNINGKHKDEESRWKNRVHQVINLISDFCYMIFSALAVAVWVGLLVVPTVALLLPLTVALVCSFTNYFFKNLVTLNDENRDMAQLNNAWNNHKCSPQPVPVRT